LQICSLRRRKKERKREREREIDIFSNCKEIFEMNLKLGMIVISVVKLVS
jgi:hypothetical protein